MTCSVRNSTRLGYSSAGNGSSIVCATSPTSSWDVERQVHLRQREAVDVAVQERVGVGGHRDVEAARPEAADHRVVVAQVRRTGMPARLHQADRPAVAQQRVADRDRPLPHGGPPVGATGGGQLDLAEDEVDDAVDELVLVGEVVVKGHRLDAELLAQLAHAEGLEATLIGVPRAVCSTRSRVSGMRRAASVVRVVIGVPFGPAFTDRGLTRCTLHRTVTASPDFTPYSRMESSRCRRSSRTGTARPRSSSRGHREAGDRRQTRSWSASGRPSVHVGDWILMTGLPFVMRLGDRAAQAEEPASAGRTSRGRSRRSART